MKIAPIVHGLRQRPDAFEPVIVHTGQHYDERLSDVFFKQLGIPEPDVNLEIGSGTHGRQTAAIMAAFEPLLLDERPDLVLVVGDVNSTIACALVAAKAHIPVVHVEAGLRSRDRTMPEEINRVLTDQISDLLFTTERSAGENLLAEGISGDRIHFVGNVMIDTLLKHRQRARDLRTRDMYSLPEQGYVVLTLHRPSNVDEPHAFEELLKAIEIIAADQPVLFPVHPRTQKAVKASARASALLESGGLRLLDPLGYLEFVSLMDAARVVLTDSGGIQEETTILGVPCLTLRTSTERPVTVTEGTNQVVGTQACAIIEGYRNIENRQARIPELWDGRAAERIVDILSRV